MAVLYEVLKPGSFVTKSSPTTTIINEPGRAPVKVQDSDLAKFGTKAERSTNLWVYAQRRPAHYEKTTEFKIAKHSNDLKKQKRGKIKIRHCQRDTTSLVSSVNSNVSRALTVRKPTKPQLKRRHNVLTDDMHEDVPTQDQPLISIVPAPPTPASQVPSHRHRTTKQKAASAIDPNFMASQMQTFPQKVPWLHQVPLNQRSARIKKIRKYQKKQIRWKLLFKLPNNQESRHHPDPTYNWGKFHQRTPELDILNMSKNGKCRFGMQRMNFKSKNSAKLP